MTGVRRIQSAFLICGESTPKEAGAKTMRLLICILSSFDSTIYLAMYTFDLVFRDCNPLLALHHMLVFLLVFVGQQMREYTSKDALLSRAFLPMLMPGICITDAAGDICQLLYRLPPLTPANPVPGVAIHMLSSLQLVLRIVQWWLMLAYRQRYNDQIADALEYGINWVLYGALMLFVYMEFQDVLIYSTWRPALTIRQTNAAARRLRETQVEASVELASMLGEPLEEFDEVRRNEMMELINAARAESLAFRNGTIAPENRRFLESSYALLNEFDGIAFQDGRQTTPRRPRTKNPDPSAFPNPYGNQPDFTPSRLRPPWSATRQYYNQIDNNQPIQFQQTKTPMSQRRSRRGGDSGRSLPPPYSEAPSAIRNMSMMQQQQQQAFSPYKGLVIPTTPKTPTPSKSGGRRSRTKAITFDDSNPF